MKYVLYNHVGSANHGCEALVRTISSVFGEQNICLLSEAPQEERKYGISNLIDVRPAVSNTHSTMEYLKAIAELKLKKDYFPLDALPYQDAIRRAVSKDDVLISIGGDIYCYSNYPKYILIHKYARKFVKKTILLGCSIEPSLLSDQKLLEDLRSYDLISARESITFQALKAAGLTNVIQCPDTAFGMLPEETDLPEQFLPGNTVGLNISPLVLKKGTNGEQLMNNYRKVISFLLDDTDCTVALVPHVAWENNDDSVPLKQLYDEYKNSHRVCLIPDLPAPKIKYIISKCSYFIGARTHATIAAYSTGIPTLVLGYSIKSKGIARDLFGTEKNYVIDYKTIMEDDVILDGFIWILEHNQQIKGTLNRKIQEINAQLSELYQNITSRL